MARSVLEQVSEFGDYSGGYELAEIFKLTNNEHTHTNCLSNVRVSPDARHIHVIISEPANKVGLVTYDKYERPQQPPQNQKTLWSTRPVPIVDVLYLDLDHNKPSNRDPAVAVVYEDGKAEFWRFQEGINNKEPGWHLLQTSDLCNSPRAKVVSVCACAGLIIWCEERPASESSPVSLISTTRNNLRYCICRRDFEVIEEGAVSLGGVKIALHNNPKFTVVSSGEYIHLLPDLKVKPLLSISKFFLSWSPRHDSLTVSTTCKNAPLKRLSAKESDFKRLATDCLGYLSTLDPPQIYDFSPTSCGDLLLLLSTGWVCLLQKDGILRKVYKLADNCSVKFGVTHTGLRMYGDILALVIGQNLHLIDVKCGRELEKMALKREGLLYVNNTEKSTIHLLSETGLFVVANKETVSSPTIKMKCIHPGALLVEAVFEEACKYYQQRSLSSTQLTVDGLKKGGRFQAPTSLATIVGNYLSNAESAPAAGQKATHASQNGGEGGFTNSTGQQDKLTVSLDTELKALVSLEDVKGSLVRGTAKEVETLCENLVEKEVARLLSSPEMDREALLYLNHIFKIFPCQMWRAAQTALQLHYNGEGSLSSKASPDMWKTVLSPSVMTSQPSPSLMTSSSSLTNGRPKHNNRSVKGGGDHNHNNANFKTKKPSPQSSFSPPNELPVFELLCHSIIQFQPGWLPQFLELSQQQQQTQGSSGLGLSLVSTNWNFSGSGRASESGGEINNNLPLYKRALRVLSGLNTDRDRDQQPQCQDLEVEILLVSGRPNAILQALRMLMAEQKWERVTEVAQKFCKQSPLLNKEIFTTLLCEVAQHRDLDPYLDVLWLLCPEDLTVTSILNLVLKNLPSPNAPRPPSSSSSSSSSSLSSTSSFAMSTGMTSSVSAAPFADSHSSHLTIGLLKPLLRKVLQRETKPSQRYADILQSPVYPPPTPPRQPTEQPGTPLTTTDDTSKDPASVNDTQDKQSPTHTTTVPRARGQLPATAAAAAAANPV